MAYTDQYGNKYLAKTVSVGEPTKATNHNNNKSSIELNRNSKSAILPMSPCWSVSVNMPYGWSADNESGAIFQGWYYFNEDDTDARTIIDVSDYEGVLSPSFQTVGLKWRWIQAKIWVAYLADSETWADNPFYPGGEDDPTQTKINELSLVSSQWFSGNGASGHQRQIKIAEEKVYDYIPTMTLDFTEAGDMTAKFSGAQKTNGGVTLYKLIMFIEISAGPRFQSQSS